jgi:hypothetical protein
MRKLFGGFVVEPHLRLNGWRTDSLVLVNGRVERTVGIITSEIHVPAGAILGDFFLKTNSI